MKKILVALLSLVMALALCACGNSAPAEEETALFIKIPEDGE